MNRKLQLSLLSFFILLLVSHAWAEVNLTELVKKVQTAVVTIITYDKSNKVLGLGSGFFINNKGHLITNYHVLKGAYRTEVKAYDGKKYPIKLIIAEDKAMDLISVLVDIPAESVQWVNISKTTPSIAERILVVGSPMGLEQTVSEGIISAIREIPNFGTIYQISAPISSGSSGSPVVNMNAEVIGVTTFYLLEGQNLNFAVPGKKILTLVKKKSKKVRLFVDTEPKGTRIRILNIKPKFYQGIDLEPGSYHLEVSAEGYETKKIWINVNDLNEGKKKVTISLKKLYHRFHTEKARSDSLVYLSKGISHDKHGRHLEAIEAYKQAIRIDPDSAQTHYNIGVSYGKLGRHVEAIGAYKQAIRIDFDYIAAHYNLGNTYGKLGRHVEAIGAYKQAIRIDPDFAAAHYNLGVSYGKLGRHVEAIEACKQGIRIDPNDAAPHNNLGTSYGKLGRHVEAIEAYKQAIRIDPYYVDAHYSLGVEYLIISNRGAAFEQYKILKNLDNNRANKLFNLIYQ